MSYVIATDSRKAKEVLFMVNRNVQQASFWSNRVTQAFEYADKEAAQLKARSFRFNNPRVMSLEKAMEVSMQQSAKRCAGNPVSAEGEGQGWDAHKGWTS